jgi:hypothetical protein
MGDKIAEKKKVAKRNQQAAKGQSTGAAAQKNPKDTVSETAKPKGK